MDFEQAAQTILTVKACADEEKLQIYGLFKQGTVGDVNVRRPSGLLSFKAKAKWDAWNEKKGKSLEDAKKEYIMLVKSIMARPGNSV